MDSSIQVDRGEGTSADGASCRIQVKAHSTEQGEIKYDKEVERWLKEGILQEWPDEVGGVLPLIAVVQES